MNPAPPLPFPGSRTVAAWWRELAPHRPLRLWLSHLLIHRVEAQVEVLRPYPLGGLRLEVLICKITGWDVLRPRDAQDRPDPPTYKAADKWTAAVVARFYQHKLKKQPRSRMSKADMLAELFPEEAPATEAPKPHEEPKRERKPRPRPFPLPGATMQPPPDPAKS